MGDVLLRGWASIQAREHVESGHPLTRLRGVCPRCGNRTLHLYPFLNGRPGYEVFLRCECGLGDFCDEDDRKVRAARPSRSASAKGKGIVLQFRPRDGAK